ncbi:MAG: N-acetylmuramoyl-L-alanine amidase [Phycisphaerae bacterium]|nr:N-acetylmuramoyl-L-alanine amidase [Phycisphaerae bacterium]
MASSRTVKTLTALIISMTVGTFVLLVLQTGPIIPHRPELAARTAGQDLPAVLATEVDLQADRWQRIVIHTAAESRGIASRCHFVVDHGRIVARPAWRRQQQPAHVAPRGTYDYNAESIGICLAADYTRRGAVGDADRDALVRLVQGLQRRCGIDRSLVYFHNSFTGTVAPTASFADAVESRWLALGG